MIHVFGNSHAALFTGAHPCGNVVPKVKEVPRGRGYTDRHPTLPFRTWFLGPVLAYNFFENHFSKIKNYINGKKEWFPEGTKIVLVCGEVDCRLHVPKQVKIQPDKTQKELVQEVVDRFFRTGPELKKIGFEPIFFGTHPTTAPEHWFGKNSPGPRQHPDMQHNWFEKGISEDRNNFCVIWNNCLREKCKEHDITFISIYDHLVDEKNVPKKDLFIDPIHLSHNKCIGFIIEEFKKANIDLGA